MKENCRKVIKRIGSKKKMKFTKLMKNPKFFHSYSRRFFKTNEKMSGFLTTDGEVFSDPFKQAEMLREQYQSVNSKPNEAFLTEKDFFT